MEPIVRRIGRPTACTPELTERICEDLRRGLTFKMACEGAGISQHTGHEWTRRGQLDLDGGRTATTWARFAAATTRARSDCLASLVSTVRTAAVTDWRAAAWMLERRDPDGWSRRTEVSGPDGAPIQVVDLTAQLDAALKARSSRDLGIPANVLALPDPTVVDVRPEPSAGDVALETVPLEVEPAFSGKTARRERRKT
jgi:hypothetical protein